MKASRTKYTFPIIAAIIGLLFSASLFSGPLGLFSGRGHGDASTSDNTVTAPGVTTESYDGRNILVFAPSQLPAKGVRPLVIVLHGGLGSAEHIEGDGAEKALSMDTVAAKNGFIVAYLNGTVATRRFGADRLAWNAGGGCCGQPAANNVDDVGYISGAINFLVSKYGVDPKHIYGMGHSNGAMMTQRLMCETNLYAAAVVISGPLNTKTSNCPSPRGKHILAIHGAEDENVPIAGGQGTQGMSKASYNSEAYTQQVYANSGADYRLQIVQGADHKVENLNGRIMQTEGISIAEKAARFFGLAK